MDACCWWPGGLADPAPTLPLSIDLNGNILRNAVRALLIAACVPSGQAVAADDPPLDPEIIVWARRVAERPLDSPLALTAYQADQITARASSDLADLVTSAPNIGFDSTASLSGASNAASIFIRGVGQSDFAITTDPGIGVYVDGVYLARATGADLDLLDLHQVEILRGPQGTLFGRNTIGGAINLTTRKPDLNVFEGQAEATVGRFQRRDLRAVLNLPISSSMAVRLAGARLKRDIFGRRLLTGQHLGGQDRYELRFSGLWQPSHAFEARLTVDYSQADEQSPVSTTAFTRASGSVEAPLSLFTGLLYNNLIGNPAPCQQPTFVVPFCGIPGLIALPALPPDTPLYDARWLTNNLHTSFATGPTGSRYDILGLTGMLSWQAGEMRIKSTTGYRSSDFHFARDPDGSPLAIVETSNAVDHSQVSQEIEIGSGEANRFHWVAGVYYLGEHASENITAPLGQEAFNVINRLGLGCTYLPGLTGLAGPITLNPCPNPFSITMVGSGVKIRNQSIAGYGEATLPLGAGISLTAGIRWTRDSKRVDLRNYRIAGLPFSPNPRANAHFERLTPRVILDYKPISDLLVYASFSTGYKSGGFNERYGAPIAAGPTSFAPESVKSFELGTKASLVGGRLTLATALFHSLYNNIQVVVFDNAIPRTINAARGKVDGFEFEATALPIEALTLQIAYGYLDARYTRLDPAVIGSFGIPIVNPLVLSYDFVNSPRHSVTASVEYRMSVCGGTLTPRAELTYQSRTANDAVNTPELVQPALALLRMRIHYTTRGEKFSVALFGTNLTNKRFIVSGAADPVGFGRTEVNGGQPREWGLSITSRF